MIEKKLYVLFDDVDDMLSYYSSLQELIKEMIRPVTIKAVLSGWIAEVGCQTLVFNTLDDLIMSLKEYLIHPVQEERKFLTQSVNANNIKSEPETARDPLIGTPEPGPGGAFTYRGTIPPPRGPYANIEPQSGYQA